MKGRHPKQKYTGPPTETGGREARERAEQALSEVRSRRRRVLALRTALIRDREANHYGEAVSELFRGGRTWPT